MAHDMANPFEDAAAGDGTAATAPENWQSVALGDPPAPAPAAFDGGMDTADTDTLLGGDIEAGGGGAAGPQDGKPTTAGAGAGSGAGQPAAPAKQSMCAVLTVDYYKPFFNVDTVDVLARIKTALLPLPGKPKFVEVAGDTADLYGPFWLCTTLVFIIAACANFSSWVSWKETDVWVYDFTHVTYAASLVYGFAAGVPTIMWLGLKWLNAPLKLVTLCSLYGYCLLPFAPAIMLCTTKFEALDWIALLLAFALSSVTLIINLWALVSANASPQHARIAVGLVFAWQFLFALLLKLLFF